MKVEILGCGGGIGIGLRTTSLLIDSDILIDAGTGVGDLEVKRMRKIRHLFLTHAHLDHILAMPLMADNMFGCSGGCLKIYALPESIAALQTHILNGEIWPDFTALPTPENPVLSFHPMHPGEIKEIDGRLFEMIPVNHTAPSVGYHVQSDSGSFAFSGDTSTNDTFWEFLNRKKPVDQLFVECSFLSMDREISQAASHYDAGLLAEDLKKLDYKTEVRISHLKPGFELEIMEECNEMMPDIALQKLERGEIIEF